MKRILLLAGLVLLSDGSALLAQARGVARVVVKLPRAPGAREQRWTHLLCGPVDMSAPAVPESSPGDSALVERVATLEATVATLQAQLADLRDQLGLSQPGQP